MWFRGSGSRKDGGRDAKTPRFLGLMPRLDLLVLAVWKHGNVKRMGRKLSAECEILTLSLKSRATSMQKNDHKIQLRVCVPFSPNSS